MTKLTTNDTIKTLQTILDSPCPPPLIHLHHPHTLSTSLPEISIYSRGVLIRVDTVECHSPRILFSAISSRLKDILELSNDDGEREVVNTFDGLIRQLREIWSLQSPFTSTSASGSGSGSLQKGRDDKNKGKRKADEVNGHIDETRGKDVLVIVISKAERLGKVIGPGWSVVTRLAQLTGLPLCMILASTVPWDELRPFRGDAIEPVHLYLPSTPKQEIIRELSTTNQHPLYPRFLDLILSSLLPVTNLPQDIEYISSILWPIYTALLPPHLEQTSLGRKIPDESNPPPPLTITMKLLTDLKHQFSLPLAAAIEAVLTRQTGYNQFQSSMVPSTTNIDFAPKRNIPRPPGLEVPLCAKYLLVAAYCASYNPAKSDLRLFGRGTGPDGKRKKGGGTRRAGYGKVRMGKIAQRLLGPKSFPLDRFLAIFASIYAEHAERPDDLAPTLNDSDISDESDYDEYATVAQRAARVEKRRKRDAEREERWDDEVDHLTMSVNLWSLIPELEAQGLLQRVSPPDRLDGIMFRCEVDYEVAKEIARELKITLDDYIYEAVS